jgi:5-methylcytosine-specific restriction endonuclease McrA
MKSIDIIGKRNIDKINKTENSIRQDSMRMNIDDIYYTHNKQIEVINKLYLEQDQEASQIFKREIRKKIMGYKNQDLKKKIIDLNKLISLDQTIELLMTSKMKCFYCGEICELVYKTIFSKKQWTLDRINNKNGHNYDNVVISCLECNVKRGDMDSERFKRGKNIKIVRKQY